VEPSEELPFYHPNTWNRPLVDTGAEQPLTYGDTVRVRTTKEALAAGLAGLVGIVHGQTVPSSSGQEVALTPRIDYAVGVYFDELEQLIFLPHDVLEFIDHGPGQAVSLKTNRGYITWVRLESGEWKEVEGLAEQEVPTGINAEPKAPSLIQRLLRFFRQKT
jgi:hypothetical protein